MERQEILSELRDIFREVLEVQDIELKNETTAADVEGWDSLAHIQLIVAIEKRFKLKFTAKEILSWKNVGEMVDCILEKGV